MLFGWWLGSGHELSSQATKLVAIGRLAGIIATICVLLELLVMSRAPFIEQNFDLHEINEFHRYLGYTMTFALIAHMMFLTVGYGVTDHLSLWPQFVQLNNQFEDVLKATIGSVLFFAIAISSIKLIRKRVPYEVWYFLHIVVYGSVLLAFGHQVHSGGDVSTTPWMQALWYGCYALVFGLVAYYRFARPLWYMVKYQFNVQQIVQESHDTYSVYIKGKSLHNFTFKAGQYAHWRFFDKYLWLEGHPFSFSSIPGSDLLRFTFKASGDYTKQLTLVKPGTKVMIDGPRGAFTADRARQDNNLLIAGGIGVAPFIATATALLRQGKSVKIIYSVRNKEDTVYYDEFKYLLTAAPNQFTVQYHISSEQGHLGAELLRKNINGAENSTNVFICGPDAMTEAIQKLLPNTGVPASNIFTERFMF